MLYIQNLTIPDSGRFARRRKQCTCLPDLLPLISVRYYQVLRPVVGLFGLNEYSADIRRLKTQ